MNKYKEKKYKNTLIIVDGKKYYMRHDRPSESEPKCTFVTEDKITHLWNKDFMLVLDGYIDREIIRLCIKSCVRGYNNGFKKGEASFMTKAKELFSFLIDKS